MSENSFSVSLVLKFSNKKSDKGARRKRMKRRFKAPMRKTNDDSLKYIFIFIMKIIYFQKMLYFYSILFYLIFNRIKMNESLYGNTDVHSNADVNSDNDKRCSQTGNRTRAAWVKARNPNP